MKSVRGKANNIHPVWKIFMLVLLMLLSSFFVVIFYGLVCGTRQDLAALKFLQTLQTVCVFVLPCLLCAYLWDVHPMHYLQMDRLPSVVVACFTVLTMLLALPGINLLSWCNQQIQLPGFLAGVEQWMQTQENNAAVLTERFIKADTVGVLFANLFIMALLPAVGEELCFRGVIQKLFQPAVLSRGGKQISKTAIHLSVWVSAILFSAMHLQFYGFVPRMLLGAFFGYLLVWSGSLWLPVLAHFTNNAMAVLLYNCYYMRGISTDEIDMFGAGPTLWVGCVSIAVTLFCIWGVYRLCHGRKLPYRVSRCTSRNPRK